MIAWTIEAAINSKLFHKVIVSTDSAITASIAQQYGATGQIRPKGLSGDKTPIIDVVKYVADGFEGTVALLYAASPTMTAMATSMKS